MKTGYPFLAISKKHNVEYQHVLFVADNLKNKKHLHGDMPMLPEGALEDIQKATTEFQGMQLGLFDWQAGHNVA